MHNKRSLPLTAIHASSLLVMVMFLLHFTPLPVARANPDIILRVTTTGASTGTCGASWASPCSLQHALAIAVSGDELWVKQGTYKPTTGTDRSVSFILKSGVALYGGFAGTETLRKQRNWSTNITTLSGDIGTLGHDSDNSYHVVATSNVNYLAILDGFTITGGYANGGFLNNNGGGIYNWIGYASIYNTTVIDNYAAGVRRWIV